MYTFSAALTGDFMRIKPFVLLMLGTMIVAGQVLAETKTVTKQNIYHATEADNKQSARWTAVVQAKRLLLEDLCAYLERMAEVISLQLGNEEILSLTAGITDAEIIKEEWDGDDYLVEAKMTADLESVVQSIDKLRHNDSLKRELEREKQIIDHALREKEKLNKELDAAYYNANIKYEEYDEMVKRIIEKQKKGAGLLALAKDAAMKPGMEKQAREYRHKAIEFLGKAVVQTELPEFKIYIQGKKYSFSLKEGEQTDHWLAFPDSDTKFKLSQVKGSKFIRVYEDESAGNFKQSVLGKNSFKLRAIKNSYIVLEVMSN
jgi:flagellar hook assembly protein FlgD